MLRNLLIGLVGLMAMVSCASTGAHGQVSANPQAITSALDSSARENGEDAEQAVGANKPLMLVFWQSWCGGCVAEAPLVQQVHRKYADRLSVVGVVSGPDKSVDAFKLDQAISRLGLTYPQVRDRDDSLTHLFGVQGTPDVVILNTKREVVYRGHELPASIEPYL